MLGKISVVGLGVIVLAYLIQNYYYKELPSPVVAVKNGKLQGIVSKSRNGREFFSYLGIPYAKPPVGELRFEPPQPLDKNWDGVRDASTFGAFCLQIELFSKKIAGEEDCLFLNVFKPEAAGTTEKPIPVMVFFHGGAFVAGGSNRYPGKYFMDEDIVLVTLNYRLGALGFLNTGDKTVSGNMGLKDQVQALKWVQQNILNFGGDPTRVTIFGNSAGGASTHYHLLSPLSKGLFHRAISQSGTAISHWANFKKPREQAQRFAGLLNCPTMDSVKMIECLKKVAPLDLAEIHKEVLVPLREWIKIFVPTVEVFPDENSFLPAEPLELLKKGVINRVPWITGANSQEGLFFSASLFRNETMLERLRNGFDDVAGKMLDISPHSASNFKKLEQLKKFYIEGGDSESKNLDELGKYTNLLSDRYFIVPSHKSAVVQAPFAPVYLYYYTHTRDVSLAHFIFATKGNYPAALEIGYHLISTWINKNIFGIRQKQYGVCHADELGMFYPVIWDSDITPESKDYQISTEIVKLWVAFAYDKPLKIQNVEWKSVDPKAKTLKYLKLDQNSEMVDTPFQSRLDLWNSLQMD